MRVLSSLSSCERHFIFVKQASSSPCKSDVIGSQWMSERDRRIEHYLWPRSILVDGLDRCWEMEGSLARLSYDSRVYVRSYENGLTWDALHGSDMGERCDWKQLHLSLVLRECDSSLLKFRT